MGKVKDKLREYNRSKNFTFPIIYLLIISTMQI